MTARQLEGRGVVERHGHGERARSRGGRRVEEAAHGPVLDLGRLHEQQPGVIVGALVLAHAQDLELEDLFVLARRVDAPLERLDRVVLLERLETGAQRERDLARLTVQIRLEVGAPRLERRDSGGGQDASDEHGRHDGHARAELHPLLSIRRVL
jgi:hypothetical protein